MASYSTDPLIETLLQRHGMTFCEELGITIARNTPSELFRLLSASLLYSTRISYSLATKAIRAVFGEGWITAPRMAAAGWEERTRVLNQAGYARYDESTSTRLGDCAGLLIERYRGDIRRLREEAKRDPWQERRLLKQCKGIGDVGVDIFFREIQLVWEELYPFADKRILEESRRLGIADTVEELAGKVARKDFVRLTAALVRTRLEKDEQRVVEAAHI
jgi:hypothetical protein